MKPINYIQGYFDKSNIGDEMLLMAILQNYKEGCIISSSKELKYLKNLKVISLDGSLIFKERSPGKVRLLIGYLRSFFINGIRCKRLIFAGGTQFTFTNELKAISLLQIIQVWIFFFFRRKIIAESIGIHYEDSALNRILVKILFYPFEKITVRDKFSSSILNKVNIIHRITHDLVEIEKSLFLTKKQNSKNILITVPASDYNRVIRIIGDLRKLIAKLRERDLKIIGVVMQDSSDIRDSELLDKLNLDSICYPQNISHFIQIIANSYLLLGMRFHSCVIAKINEVPFITIGDSLKIKDYATKNNVLNWCSNIDDNKIINFINQLK